METVITFFVTDLRLAMSYYLEGIAQFKLLTSSSTTATLFYLHNENLFLTIAEKESLCPMEISLQVPNAENLFTEIEKKNLHACGIESGAYKFQDNEITFLTAPPGNYFYTRDPFGNRIQFFDKYDERV